VDVTDKASYVNELLENGPVLLLCSRTLADEVELVVPKDN
jgi:hypothetical protein